jgi:hypothetical protein
MKIYSNYREHQSNSGFVIVLFCLLLSTTLAFLAFALDSVNLLAEHRRLQISADALSIAGANALGPSADYPSVSAFISNIAGAHSVTEQEMSNPTPRCGIWQNGTFVPRTDGLCDKTSTAVEVTLTRSVSTSFARFIAFVPVTISARAVTYRPTFTPGNCIRPFGVENSYLTRLNLTNGATFTVNGTQGPGNWGKIDLYGNASSGTEYTSLMLNNLCDDQIVAGNIVSVGTGNAQISDVFQTILSDSTPPYAWHGMVFAVTSDFPNGNGVVQILRFIRVDLVSQQGNGQNWSATLRITDVDTEPDPRIPPARVLMQ